MNNNILIMRDSQPIMFLEQVELFENMEIGYTIDILVEDDDDSSLKKHKITEILRSTVWQDMVVDVYFVRKCEDDLST